ncbi:hypothetical protein ACTXT7_005695 [Hymenolepis weldensis]
MDRIFYLPPIFTEATERRQFLSDEKGVQEGSCGLQVLEDTGSQWDEADNVRVHRKGCHISASERPDNLL